MVTRMLYFVEMIRRDGETEGDKDISSRLCFRPNWKYNSFKYSKNEKKILMFYDHSLVSSKVVNFNLLTLERESATHNVVGVMHRILLFDFSFEI